MQRTASFDLDKFKLIAGDLSLEFVNTVSGYLRELEAEGRGQAIRGDKFLEYSDLLAWALKNDIVDEDDALALLKRSQREPAAAKSVLKQAVKFRGALYRIFRSMIVSAKPAAGDLDVLNAEILRARRHQRLIGRGRRLEAVWDTPDTDLGRPLWPVAVAAGRLLTSDSVSRIKECGGDSCGWLFVDESRGGNRHWCDMRDCGNVAKVRRFRRKNRGAE